MQVTLERGGGVMAGAHHQRIGPVDTGQVEDGSRIETLVSELDFFEMSDDFPNRAAAMSDPTWHSVRVVDGDGDRTIRWRSDQQPPEGLRELRDLVASLGEWEPVEGS